MICKNCGSEMECDGGGQYWKTNPVRPDGDPILMDDPEVCACLSCELKESSCKEK